MAKYDTRHLRNEKYCVGIVTDSLPDRWNTMHRDSDAERLAAIARRHGVNPEAAHYYPQLARFPGDPEAFVTSRSEIKRVLEKRGLAANGFVEYEPQGFSSRQKKPYRVADDLVERYVQESLPPEELAAKKPDDVAEMRDKIRTKLSGTQDE